MGISYDVDQDDYGPDAVLFRIFTGSSAAGWAECYAELSALGNGPEGDRLRCLFQRLVELLQGAVHVHHGCLIGPAGRPISNREIARLVLWDVTTIGGDLYDLSRVGLMECIRLEGCQA